MWQSRLPRPPSSYSYIGNSTTLGGYIPDTYITTSSTGTSISQIEVTYQPVIVQEDPHCPICEEKMDKIHGLHQKESGYWICPKCGVMFKPKNEEATEEEEPSEKVVVGSTSD